MTECGKAFLFTAFNTAWIGKAPMYLVTGVGKEWAGFSRLIANCHNQVHRRLIAKLFQAFCPLVADINANLLHYFDRQWMYDAGMGASTEHRVGRSATGAEQPLRYLRTGRVVCTKEEDT